MAGIFDTVVDPQVHALVRRELALLVELRETLESDQRDEVRRVEELIAGLDELFTIVIVGEFNAGKSSIINALFGARLRTEGPIPVDDRISILKHGESNDFRRLSEHVVQQHYPVELLRLITLVDTPGTNSIVTRHQEITEDFIPRSDLVLFVTSIDRPLSESERRFLELIRTWGKKIVFVLNKIDTKSDAEIAQVVGYLRENLRPLLDVDPVIYPVAAKRALEAKIDALPREALVESRFEELERFMVEVLSEKERVRLKLEAPLETVASLMRQQLDRIGSRRDILATDLERIESVERQLATAREDLRQNFSQFTVRIENLMMELEVRGSDFLDRYVRIQHLMLLRDPLRFRDEFQRQVFFDWEGSVDRTIQEGVDWLVRHNMRLWNDSVGSALGGRNDLPPADELVGKVGQEFAYNRDEIYSRMRGEAERRMKSYDVATESRRTIDAAMSGVMQSLGLGAGALGLGYLVTTAVTSAALDVTGLTAATLLMVTAFFVLPYKRRKAMNEFRQRIGELRGELGEALRRESSAEIDRMMAHIGEAFEPYRRFYGNQTVKLDELEGRLKQIEGRTAELAAEIRALA